MGLDIGIGSVGWAVINLDKNRIEDFGVRIFDTGEDQKAQKRESQKRRERRSSRRHYRRKSHRKQRIKEHLENIGLTTKTKIAEYFENGHNNIIEVRYRGISQQISPEEIAACLINICNGRGYRDFYEIDEENLSKEELKEFQQEKEAIGHISDIMKKGKYSTVSEMIYKDPEFKVEGSEFRKYRNKDSSEKNNLISRDMLKKEVSIILETQKKYYKCLTEDNINKIINIIFSQRDFEDGPGNPNDNFRKYKGFLDSLGKCRFYLDENRGSRFTALADVYSLVNVLSQYQYFDNNGEFCFNSEIASVILEKALQNGNMTKKDLASAVKSVGVKINESGNIETPVTKCFKYIKSVKPVFESFGYNWSELISDYEDIENNLLNQVGIVLSENITPARRRKALMKLDAKLDEKLVDKLTMMKFSGTTNVSYKYMRDSIEAFLNGDIYGKFQAQKLKEDMIKKDVSKKPAKLPPFKNEDDSEFYKNPVVMRAINETRKVINAVIEKYGYPCAVNLETADEVNRSFEDRRKDTKNNEKNEKENSRIRKEISELLKISEENVKPVMVEKFKLWESQEHKCLYSGKDIDAEIMLNDKDKIFEIDHIIPFSIILDNTLNNKALVYSKENQGKGQRTPLMFMELCPEKTKEFKARVNAMLKSGKCSKKKYLYLMLENLNDSELLSQWKSRNLNDTRYIAKYLVNYLRENLRFNEINKFPDGFSIKDQSRVFAVKSKFVSNFRRQWLNPKTWGRKDKGELKAVTYLDHAADAIVIANCRPEYVILAGEKMKLYRIFKNAGKRYNDEYNTSLNNCVESLYRYYGMDRDASRKILKGADSGITPIVKNIYNEVDNRLRDYNTHRELLGGKEDCNEKIYEIFVNKNKELYADDPEFAGSLHMPVISYKQERKFTGQITDDNAVSVKEIDGKLISDLKLNRLLN